MNGRNGERGKDRRDDPKGAGVVGTRYNGVTVHWNSCMLLLSRALESVSREFPVALPTIIAEFLGH